MKGSGPCVAMHKRASPRLAQWRVAGGLLVWWAGLANAEGIALGNPLANANLFNWIGLPIVGILVLAVVLLVLAWRTLLAALAACGAYLRLLAVSASGGLGNPAALLWLVLVVLSPWVCLGVFVICTLVAVRRAARKPAPGS